MSKRCTHCGSPLPDAAYFCPICTQQQQVRAMLKPPRRWRKNAVAIAICLLAVALLFFWFYEPEPQHVEGIGQVVYQDGKSVYQLTICINPSGNSQPWAATSEVVTNLDPDASFRYPAQLLIYRNGYDPDIQQEFLSKMASCTVSARSVNSGSPMECTLPAPTADFSDAALVSHITYTASCLRNEIIWDFLMENGDTIRLTHTIEANPLETLHIYPEDEPMSSSSELQALLDKIEQTVDPNTIVYLHLPAVTYTEPLRLTKRTVNLYGSTDASGAATIFTAGLYVDTKQPSMVCLQDLIFQGNGGYGLEAHYGVALENCTFTGWGIGAYAGDGGSFGLEHCTFTNNQTGVKLQTDHYSYFRGDIRSCLFEYNSIGFWNAELPGANTLEFPGSHFRNNGVDIQNDAGHTLDLTNTLFE